MTVTRFIDTNVLLYAGSNAKADADKKAIARRLLAEPGIAFSAQVLQEFYDAAVRKKRLQITDQEAEAVLLALRPFPVLPVSRELVLAAVRLKTTHGLSYWDAAILAAALELDCRILYSEDFCHNRDYSGILVINPFLDHE